MTVRTLTLRGKDEISAPVSKAAGSVNAFSRGVDILDAALSGLAETQQEVTAEAKLQAKAAKIAARGMEEYDAKVEDAAKKMGEFQATNAQMQQGFIQSTKLAKQYNVSLGQSGEILEELAIQTQNPTQALLLQEKAMKLMIRTNSRADDAAEDVAKAMKGETAALKNLSAAGARAADQIDKIKDPQLRAKASMKALNAELARGPRAVDQLSDRLQLMRVNINSAFGGFDVAGGAVKAFGVASAAAGVAVAAAAAKVVQFGIEATKAYIEATPRAKAEVDLLSTSMQGLRVEIGEAIAQESNMLVRTQDLAISVKFMTGEVDSLQLSFRKTVRDIEAITGNLGDMGASIAFTIPRLIGLGDALDKLAEKRTKFAEKERENIRLNRETAFALREVTNEGNKWARTVQLVSDKLIKNQELTFNEVVFLRGDKQKGLFDEQLKIREKLRAKLQAAADKAAEREEKGLAASGKRQLAAVKSDKKLLLAEANRFLKALARSIKEEDKLFDDQHKAGVARSKKEIRSKFKDDPEERARLEKAGLLAKEGGGTALTAAQGDVKIAKKIAEEMESSGRSAIQAAAFLRKGVGAELTNLDAKLVDTLNISIEAASGISSGMVTAATGIGQGMSSMAEQLAAGTFKLEEFAKSAGAAIGGFLVDAGQGLLTAGTISVNPGMMAAGAGMMVLGGALKGASSRKGGASVGAERGLTAAANLGALGSRQGGEDIGKRRKLEKQVAQDQRDQDRRDDFRNRTFLEGLQQVIGDDRQRQRENIQLFQRMSGAVTSRPSLANQATQMRPVLARLARTEELPSPGGPPSGVRRRR